MTMKEEEFPYKEIRDKDGNYWLSWKEVKKAGFSDNQIWSVTEYSEDDEATITYGPPRHYVNLLGYTATEERHDDNTYYHETHILDEKT